MAKAQHRTPEYRAAYQQLRRAQAAGQWLVCVESECKRSSRDISPLDRASISHDQTGTVILGPSHLGCNLSEAASRGNRMRAARVRRLVL
ncbi:hypothetical protein [Nocardioides panaciterrulae]|uniref:Uncharacterized protein n=1 Tax=Nocardioides panaciterrulae TaxID=661492 RepID=A0A7Y9JE60_9ACTN|nr:hypothetical protein [Nocardioides panaciterrulae]NYD43944.1 hypothetical protein [Nocardioides panaciterrulae]NYD44013.1 hypothetical protein [Nocardioides panaciterrulae]